MFKRMSDVNRQASALKTSIKSTVLILVAALGWSSSAIAADADILRGSQLAETCLGCHGAPGLRNPGPVYEIPMVGGQHASYIVAALQAYKNKERDHATMQAQAASLSDQDMIDIAAFFAEMEGNSRPTLASKALIDQGKEKAGACAACHGTTGDAASDAFPKLAGQYKSYLVQSLKDYRSGARNNLIMNGQSQNLTIRDIEALSAYFASQQGGLSAPEAKIFKSF